MTIETPILDEEDEIARIECGQRISILLTKNHRIFISEMQNSKGKEEEEKSVSENITAQEQNMKAKGSKKKKSKHQKENLQKKSLDIIQAQKSAPTTKFIEITQYFAELKD